MEHSTIESRVALSCPVCRSTTFMTARRLPAADHQIVHHVTCRRCGVEFERHEDREDVRAR